MVAIHRGLATSPGELPIWAPLATLTWAAAFLLLKNVNGRDSPNPIGWRGFALVPLQQRFGPVVGTLVLAVLWAAWHTPTFFIVETYRQMTLAMIVGGFGLGICAGALVLSRIAQRTNGSILAAALWHGAYNMTSGTAASRGMIAALTTTAVMVWAVVILIGAVRRPSDYLVVRTADHSADC